MTHRAMSPSMVKTLVMINRTCHHRCLLASSKAYNFQTSHGQFVRQQSICSTPVEKRTLLMNHNLLNHKFLVHKLAENQQKTGIHTLSYKVDRYQGVHCDLGDIPDYVTPEEFEVVLQESLIHWRDSGKCAIWLQVPILMGQIIPVAAKCGFEYHHAEGDCAMLALWLRTKVPNKLPPYATHQLGVSGVVLKESSNEVLVVKDRNRPFTLWKFPGGLSELGEDIGHTAEREIKEETGIITEFRGVLAFRQQHDHPNAFGRSDLFFVCHMIPLTFNLVPCLDELEAAQWMNIDDLADNKQTSAITQRIIRLVRIGMAQGFEHVDLKADEFQSVYKGLKFKMYSHWLPKNKSEEQYSHSMASPDQVWNQK